MSEKKRKSTVGSDRISGLPEEIIHQILSVLTTKEATRTSALSKSFYSTWISFPVIHLDYERCSSKGRSEEDFIDLINRTILRRSLVKELLIRGIRSSQVDEHIPISLPPTVAGLSSISKLELVYVALNFNQRDFNFPVLVSLEIFVCSGLKHFNFSSGKIKSIKLDLCLGLETVVIESSSLETFAFEPDHKSRCKVMDITECKSLKNLELWRADIGDSWIRDTLPILPHLENLRICDCVWLENTRIVNENLKVLAISITEGTIPISIEIAATNLQSLTLNLSQPSNISIISCMHLRDITLDISVPKEFVVKFLKEQIAKLILLESLALDVSWDMKGIEINNENLKTLWLSSAPELEEVGEIKLNTPKLVSLGYYGLVTSFSVLSSKDLLHAKLLIYRNIDDVGNDYYVQLWHLIRSFSDSQVLELSFDTDQHLIFPAELREQLVDQIYDRKYINIEMAQGWQGISIELLDTLVWLWPSLQTVCFVSCKQCEKGLIKFQYERSTREEEVDSKKQCRFSLKRVEFENFDAVQRADLEKHIMKSAEFLEAVNFKLFYRGTNHVIVNKPTRYLLNDMHLSM